MRLKEIKHGRLAMAAFAFHYAGVLLEKKGVVVSSTPGPEGEAYVWNTRKYITTIQYTKYEIYGILRSAKQAMDEMQRKAITVPYIVLILYCNSAQLNAMHCCSV